MKNGPSEYSSGRELDMRLNHIIPSLMGSAPTGKKLTKGLMSPEEFRDKSRALLDDVKVHPPLPPSLASSQMTISRQPSQALGTQQLSTQA